MTTDSSSGYLVSGE